MKAPKYYIIQLSEGTEKGTVLYGPQQKIKEIMSQFQFYTIVGMKNLVIVQEVADDKTV